MQPTDKAISTIFPLVTKVLASQAGDVGNSICLYLPVTQTATPIPSLSQISPIYL